MNLLLVDGDADRAATLAGRLGALGHRIAMAETGPAALIAVERDGFDALVLDGALPRMDGLAVVRQLRERGQVLPVLMLSARGRTVDTVEGLDAGADDYVVRPAPVEEIDARLRALVRARHRTRTAAETLRAGAVVVSPSQHRAWRGDRSLDLTRLEFRLLAVLARHAGGFLTRATLVEQVWGREVAPTTNIVDAQIRSLRRKLTAGGEDDPIATRRGVGYMLRGG